MLAGKKFISNEEAIAETEAYFEVKDKAFYNHGIEELEKRWNDWSNWLKEIILMNKIDFWQKKIVFLSSRVTTYWVMC